MTSSPYPQAVPHRRRWPWILGAGMTGSALVVLLTAPRLTCRLLQRQTPLVTDVVVMHGVQFGGSPATAAMVVGRCSPAVLKGIVEGASGRWLPGVLLGDGQHAWGTFVDAPEVTWRLDIDAGASIPEITARIPQAVAERVVAGYLAEEHSPVSQVKLSEMSLMSEPGNGTQLVWQARLGGTAQLYLWGQSLAIEVEQAAIAMTLIFTLHPNGGSALQLQMHIAELRGTTPLGPLIPLIPMLEKLANQDLERKLSPVVVPGWWPMEARCDVRVVTGSVREF